MVPKLNLELVLADILREGGPRGSALRYAPVVVESSGHLVPGQGMVERVLRRFGPKLEMLPCLEQVLLGLPTGGELYSQAILVLEPTEPSGPPEPDTLVAVDPGQVQLGVGDPSGQGLLSGAPRSQFRDHSVEEALDLIGILGQDAPGDGMRPSVGAVLHGVP